MSETIRIVATGERTGVQREYEQPEAPLPQAVQELIAEFKAETRDKLFVVYNGCDSLPLPRSLHRNQCEAFLVELFEAGLRRALKLGRAHAPAPDVICRCGYGMIPKELGVRRSFICTKCGNWVQVGSAPTSTGEPTS